MTATIRPSAQVLRTQRLRERLAALGLDAIVITRPEHRYYLSGFAADAEEDGLLVVTANGQWIVTDFRYVDQVSNQAPDYVLFLNGSKLTEGAATCIKEAGATKAGFEAEHLNYHFIGQLRESLEGIDVVPTTDAVEDLRLLKDDVEIAKLRGAAALADEAYAKLLGHMKPGMTEWEVAVWLEGTMRSLGASKAAFTTIVASGPRGALPHGTASQKVMQPGELVTIDFGAVLDGYHSDMTRTLALGEPGEKAREIYALVLESQLAGLDAVAPGALCKQVDALARDVISAKGYGENFGHGLGHGVGLMIHEGPRLSSRSDQTLVPGMVVTVEPGIYISGWGGVRIEDLVVVTENGKEILSNTTKDLIII